MSLIVPGGHVEHQLGVHINQRAADYLADIGLGYSSVKDCFLSAVEWWENSPYNPLRDPEVEEEENAAFLRGEALHTYTLEGEKAYGRIWGIRPTKGSHPKALDTISELQAACERLGLPTGYKVKDDLVHRLVGTPVKVGKKWVFKPKAEVLQHLQAEFRESGLRPVTQADHFRILRLHRQMMRTADELHLPSGDITIRDALHGSLNEVSVYWVDDNGIRQRARFDMLKPNFTGDLKSITQWKKTDFRKSLLREIILRGYMIQAAHYWHARHELRKAVDEGRVFGGNKTQLKRLERIAEAEEWGWINIFAKMSGAPQVKAIVTMPEAGRFKEAMQQREEGLANFLFHREHTGMDKPWFDTEIVWEPADTDWPSFMTLGET